MSELLEAVPDDIENSAVALLHAACDRDLSLVTAESCTGGLVASLLTDVEGASHSFERGFVVYSEEAKCELLGVPQEMIDSWGAVSAQTAAAMAEGALSHSRGDIAIAITGFAGAAGPDDEPGLVHFACARRGGEMLAREEHFGSIGRGPVRIECLRVALEMLAKMVAEEVVPDRATN